MIKIISIKVTYFFKMVKGFLIFFLPDWLSRFLKNGADKRFDYTWERMSADERKRLLKTKGHGFIWLLNEYEKKYLTEQDGSTDGPEA